MPGEGGSPERSLVLATRNPHKLIEMQRLLEPAGITVQPLPDDVQLPPENGATFADNALPKAMTRGGRHRPGVDCRRLGDRGHRAVRRPGSALGPVRRCRRQR